MRVCYIISTCNKYLDTRVQYQWNTFLSKVDRDDVYYLTSQANHAQRQFGWNTMDDERNITWKYIHFIHDYSIPEDKYDWFLFIDDDTFVFVDRLQAMLQNQFRDADKMYYVGHVLDHVRNSHGLYMSGGAGYLMSNNLYQEVVRHVRKKGLNKSYKHWCDDLCVGRWVQTLKNKRGFPIEFVDDNRFLIGVHSSEEDLQTAITVHKVMTEDQYTFYHSIPQGQVILEPRKKKDTVFVLVTDAGYFERAKRTIIDVRSRGNWRGDLYVIVLNDFSLPTNFKDFYNVKELKLPPIDKSNWLARMGAHGFNNSDKRELHKTNQWEKLHIFDSYFSLWDRVVFLDAGLRVLDDVECLLRLPYKGKFLAPTDGKLYAPLTFDCQIDKEHDPAALASLYADFGTEMLSKNYFLNCIFLFDTSILQVCKKEDMIEAMNKYPLWRTNEMGVMNLIVHFRHHLWEPFPAYHKDVPERKILFDWCELNNPGTQWRDYCLLKYPVTLSLSDT